MNANVEKALSKNKISEAVKQSHQNATSNKNMAAIMSDARYLRQSSSLINDALQKGFDVMQLADGSVVISGVKTVSYQYEWDDNTGRLVRQKSAARRDVAPSSRARVNLDEIEAEEEMEGDL
jgi:hypothetical protein